AIRQRAPALSGDHPELQDSVPHAAYEGYAGAIAAPMVWSDEIRGVLGVGTQADRSFTSSDAELLEAFATLAALALRNAESFEERSRQAKIQRAFYDIASVLAAPISQGETLGAVVVFFSGTRHFSDYDLELALNLAGTARGALERSELYESERRARGLAQQLARTGTLLATELDPAAVLDEIVAQAPALLEADA